MMNGPHQKVQLDRHARIIYPEIDGNNVAVTLKVDAHRKANSQPVEDVRDAKPQTPTQRTRWFRTTVADRYAIKAIIGEGGRVRSTKRFSLSVARLRSGLTHASR